MAHGDIFAEPRKHRSGNTYYSFVNTDVQFSPLLLNATLEEDAIDDEANAAATYSPEFSPSPSITPLPRNSPSPTAPHQDAVHIKYEPQPIAIDTDSSVTDLSPRPSTSTSRLLHATTVRLTKFSALSRQERRKANNKRRSKSNRIGKNASDPLMNCSVRAGTSQKYSQLDDTICAEDFTVDGSNLVRGGDNGLHRRADESLPTLGDLLADPSWRYKENDGTHAVAVLDSTGVVVFVIYPGPASGNPNSDDWQTVSREAAALMESLRDDERVAFLSGETRHRRGGYTFVSAGPTHGNGRKEPGNLKERHPHIVDRLKRSKAIQRIAGHQDRLFRYTQPKMYKYCADNVKALLTRHHHLQRPFTNSIYTTFTANLGPASASKGHYDSQNDTHVMCACTNVGDFDYRKGGHVVLWDFKLIIEFPPGCTALIPSATLRHGNTAIAPGERRYVLVQYINGALFRWVRHGFRLASQLSPEKKAALDGTAEDRSAEALAMFSRAEDLMNDRQLL